MTALVTPSPTLHRSWAAAMSQLHAEGPHVNGAGFWLQPEAEQWDLTEAGCARLVARLLAQADADAPVAVPSRRREGHATRALALAVRRAAEHGTDRVLVTCDETNRASAATIERGGGVYEDSRHGKRRYGISTA